MLDTTVLEGNIIEIRYSGSVTDNEMQATREVIDAAVAEHGRVRLLAEYGDIDLRRIEPRAYLTDLSMAGLVRHVDKMALVSDTQWIKRVATLGSTVLGIKVETWTMGAREEALEWLRR